MNRHRSSYREPLSGWFWMLLFGTSLAGGAAAFLMVPGSGGGAPMAAMPAAASAADVAAIEASVTYAGCNEVRAAGAAPLYRGTPGYRTTMDGDDDGIACEPVR